MPGKEFKNNRLQKTRTLDARPDRPDIRDRIFMPQLRALLPEFPPAADIERYLPRYREDGMILDQGKEGACTGFGLAAVVNYLLWSDAISAGKNVSHKVSERMLYHLARIYDEWPGEDYEGSSCRGAMKGWFYHGVCRFELWPYQDASGKFVRPKDGWDTDAVTRPLGAYYRIEKNSIPDMQAAIMEVGAIYVSAAVHKGWDIAKTSALTTLEWSRGKRETGGHAFALVGYDREGFIIQNSWGPNWGYNGFARLSYEDWLANGDDAWVANMGAQIAVRAPSLMISSSRTLPPQLARLGRGAALAATVDAATVSGDLRRWSADLIERHALVLGNDGRPFPISITHSDAAAAAHDISYTQTKKWMKELTTAKKRVVLFAHGGLNSLSAGLARASVLAPCFFENDVYPIFAVWQSGAGDAIKNILEDEFAKQKEQVGPSGDFFDRLMEAASDVKDRFLEAIIARPIVKPLWTEMKENAEAASTPRGGLVILADALAKLSNEFEGVEIHIAGHSAGAVMLGSFLDLLAKKKLAVKTCTLFAPACTVRFALDHFGQAVEKNVLDKNQFSIELLSDEREKADTVGPYGKSLLYLVSRALEADHKMPILGLEAVWDEDFDKDNLFTSSELSGADADVVEWRKLWLKTWRRPAPAPISKSHLSDGEGLIPALHGCFDNAVPIMTAAIERMRGGKLRVPIKSLRGF